MTVGEGPIRDQRSETAPMGYNPYRKFTARPLDYLLVTVCVLVAAALVIWALTG